jgi:MFS family permease
MLLAGRILTGFSGGAFVLAAPSYTAEIAEAKYRGALGVLMQLMMCFGILFINVNCNTDWKVSQLRKCSHLNQ